MKNILVIYYTQTGQLKQILDSMLQPLAGNPEFSLEYLELQPTHHLSLPLDPNEFLEVFPESVLETPIDLKPFAARHPGTYDLIILAFQPWYLSPSLPISAFLQSPEAEKLIRGARCSDRHRGTEHVGQVLGTGEGAGGKPGRSPAR